MNMSKEVNMNKLEALIITGSLEVRFEGLEKLLDEIANLQKNILEDDIIKIAINLGRLQEMLKNVDIEATKELQELHNYILVEDNNANLDLTINEMEFTVRTYNNLDRAGIKTVKQLIAMSFEDLMHIKNIGQESSMEIVNKLENFGLKLAKNETN